MLHECATNKFWTSWLSVNVEKKWLRSNELRTEKCKNRDISMKNKIIQQTNRAGKKKKRRGVLRKMPFEP